MIITAEHMRASYDTYINHGNSSSATIFSVMDRMREKDMDELAPGGKVKEFVIGCAFGPGIAVEMCVLKRNLGHVKRELLVHVGGEVTPPESEGSRSEEEGERERDLEAEFKNGKELDENLKHVLPDVPVQGDSLEEALNGVELD